ncbi:hypothetical protein SAMN05444000_12656 [Shimia gijangensis]|uniref:Uncharacterized protein n=1 Tax=Shimia gijangensis TaxID=1470563 RepID=A0A1M6RVF4_9RHOB|nr:hypothetical protein [Shimia gijangensis]SHK36410.1 hypothetical protein SAMN05444000_12656 [Shimia gijangensis]
MNIAEQLNQTRAELAAVAFYVIALHLYLRGKDVEMHDSDRVNFMEIAKLAAGKEAPGYEDHFIRSVERMCGLHRQAGEQASN